MTKKSQNIFDRYPKFSTFILSSAIFLLFIVLMTFFLKIDILQDYKGGEKYSIYDKIAYAIRCNNSRSIKLRENSPNKVQNSFPITKYETLEYKKYILRTDKDGLIEPATIHKNPDFQIFFIGGSTTECETVDEEFRFPYLAGRLLEKETGLKINSENAARNGNNSLHSINILINKILPYHPNMIVMMHNINDLSTLIYEGTYWNFNSSKSHLICANKKSKTLKTNEWENSIWQNKVLVSKYEQDQLIEKFKNNLRLFVAICQAQDIIPVLMTQPNRIENNEQFDSNNGEDFNRVYRDLYAKFNQTIRDFSKQNHILMIDLAKAVPSDKEYIYDEVHMNKQGSVAAAHAITKDLELYLKRNGYLKNKKN